MREREAGEEAGGEQRDAGFLELMRRRILDFFPPRRYTIARSYSVASTCQSKMLVKKEMAVFDSRCGMTPSESANHFPPWEHSPTTTTLSKLMSSSYGTSLPDQAKPLLDHIQSFLTFYSDVDKFITERALLEREYGLKLQALSRKMSERKIKRGDSIWVGEAVGKGGGVGGRR